MTGLFAGALRRGRIAISMVLVLLAASACATSGGSTDADVAPVAPLPAKYAAIVVDAQTGEVLMARQADSIRHPASLTKMMTLYMLFEAIDAGRIRRLRATDAGRALAELAAAAPDGATIWGVGNYSRLGRDIVQLLRTEGRPC